MILFENNQGLYALAISVENISPNGIDLPNCVLVTCPEELPDIDLKNIIIKAGSNRITEIKIDKKIHLFNYFKKCIYYREHTLVDRFYLTLFRYASLHNVFKHLSEKALLEWSEIPESPVVNYYRSRGELKKMLWVMYECYNAKNKFR